MAPAVAAAEGPSPPAPRSGEGSEDGPSDGSADSAEPPAAANEESIPPDPKSDAREFEPRFLLGVEGVVMQMPPLRTDVVRLDPRSLGRSIALGGGGIFARYRLKPLIGFDVAVRSGSVRYRDDEQDTKIAQDHVAAEAGVLLYLGRGKVAQFALSGGMGGMFNRVGYDFDGRPDGSQIWGSGLVRLGAEGEFLVKRVAFTLSFRAYGVFTDRDTVSNSGALFEGANADVEAPVATLQTILIGSAGIAYRF